MARVTLADRIMDFFRKKAENEWLTPEEVGKRGVKGNVEYIRLNMNNLAKEGKLSMNSSKRPFQYALPPKEKNLPSEPGQRKSVNEILDVIFGGIEELTTEVLKLRDEINEKDKAITELKKIINQVYGRILEALQKNKKLKEAVTDDDIRVIKDLMKNVNKS